MKKNLVENTSRLTPLSTIPRIKSLIKPPPSRTSWELLLDDYLKDSKLSPNTSHLFQQSPSQPSSSNPIQQPSFYPQYLFPNSCEIQHSLPPRRYQITLDELVYLISQVGRSDLYREIVQYIRTQQLPNISSSQPIHEASNMNAYSTSESIKSFYLDNKHKQRSSRFSSQVQDKLIKKLTQLKFK